MKPKDFAKLVARDLRCLHCGETEAVAPNHRINRGMGGSKLRDQASNYVLICSQLNGLIESDSHWAKVARTYGWKLNSWEKPGEIPVYDALSNTWFQLNDDFSRIVVRQGRKQ